jgi:hypothetical protein
VAYLVTACATAAVANTSAAVPQMLSTQAQIQQKPAEYRHNEQHNVTLPPALHHGSMVANRTSIASLHPALADNSTVWKTRRHPFVHGTDQVQHDYARPPIIRTAAVTSIDLLRARTASKFCVLVDSRHSATTGSTNSIPGVSDLGSGRNSVDCGIVYGTFPLPTPEGEVYENFACAI